MTDDNPERPYNPPPKHIREWLQAIRPEPTEQDDDVPPAEYDPNAEASP